MKRTIIKIDDDLCYGCGNCVSGCHEGALQLIGGKAVMISDLYCDGLGACIGECPVGAITLEEREAEPYNEEKVMERLVPKGNAVVNAHLRHLKEHGEITWIKEGLDYLKKHHLNIEIDKDILQTISPTVEKISVGKEEKLACGCPGSMMRKIESPTGIREEVMGEIPSQLRQFPVQLHLLNPEAGFLKGSDLLLAADCTAYAYGDFHRRFMKGKTLTIACPKLDSNTPAYVEKLTAMIDRAEINTLTVVVMEVPCCSGLLKIAQMAKESAKRNIPLKKIVISVDGKVLREEW